MFLPCCSSRVKCITNDPFSKYSRRKKLCHYKVCRLMKNTSYNIATVYIQVYILDGKCLSYTFLHSSHYLNTPSFCTYTNPKTQRSRPHKLNEISLIDIKLNIQLQSDMYNYNTILLSTRNFTTQVPLQEHVWKTISLNTGQWLLITCPSCIMKMTTDCSYGD